MRGFDEVDLMQHFTAAGFESVELTHEVSRRRTRARPGEVAAFLTMRPNPNMVSYEEAARDVLGVDTDEHLAALAAILTSRPSTSVQADAFLRCRRARRLSRTADPPRNALSRAGAATSEYRSGMDVLGAVSGRVPKSISRDLGTQRAGRSGLPSAFRSAIWA